MIKGITTQLRMKKIVDQVITPGLIVRSSHTEEALDHQARVMAGNQGAIVSGSSWDGDEKVYEIEEIPVGSDVLDPEPVTEPQEAVLPEVVQEVEQLATEPSSESEEGKEAG
jgi:hypothetical protein